MGNSGEKRDNMNNQIFDPSAFKTTEEALNALRTIIGSPEPLPRHRLWGGADVMLSFRPRPGDTESSFYPAPRMVYTPHARELSWLFDSLRDAFAIESLLDGCNKIEFYGRLANAANAHLRKGGEITAAELCGAVLDEAVKMYGEMKNHTFEHLLVAFNGEIADDLKKEH